MADPKIIRMKDTDPRPLPGTGGKNGGWIRRVIYPPQIQTHGAFFGLAEVNPGFAAHRWHTHVRDQDETYKVEYPKNFEEIYHVISGTGVMQWKTPQGIKEEEVGPGDTIFMPVGIVEHQLFNNSTDKIVIAFCGCPPPQVTYTK